MLRLIPPALPGKRRLARWIWRDAPPAWSRVVDHRGFAYDVPDAREPVAFDLAIDGVYEPDTQKVIWRHLPRGGVFVDVGANIGTFAIPAAAHVGDRGRVIAIEASPDVFPYLVKNVRANDMRNVTCLHAAAVAVAGTVPFYPAPIEHFGMGALSPHFDASPVQVPGAPLDEMLAFSGVSHVDVLKIDVEGSELGVVRGARNLLCDERPPVVLIEFCDWAEARIANQAAGDAQRQLQEWGFSAWRLQDYLSSARPLEAPLERGFEMLVAARSDRGVDHDGHVEPAS